MRVFAQIDEHLNQLYLIHASEITGADQERIPEQLKQCVVLTGKFSSYLLEEIISIRQPEELTVFIHNVQASCTAISNKMFELNKQIQQQNEQSWQSAPTFFEQMLRNTEDFLQYTETHFSIYINREQNVSLHFYERYCMRIKHYLRLLKQQQKQHPMNDALMTCCMHFFNQFITPEATGDKRTCLLHYTEDLAIALANRFDRPEKGIYDGAEQILLLMNFNHEQVIHYFINKLEQEVPKDEGAEIVHQYWHTQRKVLRQHYNSDGTGLYNDRKNIVQVLLQYTEEEIYQLQHTEYTPEASKQEHVNGKRLRFTLPVAQIAILLRLMVEAGLIKVPNHTAFLKDMAVLIQTEKAGSISADSLRNKYYTPERTSIEAVKDVLFGMIKNSHKLQP